LLSKVHLLAHVFCKANRLSFYKQESSVHITLYSFTFLNDDITSLKNSFNFIDMAKSYGAVLN
jgi:hypothetical protein